VHYFDNKVFHLFMLRGTAWC